VNVAPADSEETELLRTKLDELQGRLAEYEIIEDDIADLSLFKDENSRLKDENAKLKSMLENAKSVATEAPVSAPTAVVEPEPVVKFEKSDKFELDPEDDVMKEFAAAVSAQPSPTQAPEPSAVKPSVPARDPQAEIDAMLANISVASADSAAPLGEEPLADSADTEKLLNEAQSLASEETTGTSAPETPLPESVDTEKLLNEIDSLKTSQPAAKVEDAEDAFAHFNKAAQG
jgi:hypothetical protein